MRDILIRNTTVSAQYLLKLNGHTSHLQLVLKMQILALWVRLVIRLCISKKFQDDVAAQLLETHVEWPYIR